MAAFTAQPAVTAEEKSFADRTIVAHSGKPGALLGILQQIQEHHPHKYLSAGILEYVAEKSGIPLSRIYSVATFFAQFNLDPQGEHSICVCRGTACHTHGSRNLLQRLRHELGLPDEDTEQTSVTTSDGRFTVRVVACFGQCALAPVVEVDHAIYGHVNEQTLEREVQHLGGRK